MVLRNSCVIREVVHGNLILPRSGNFTHGRRVGTTNSNNPHDFVRFGATTSVTDMNIT